MVLFMVGILNPPFGNPTGTILGTQLYCLLCELEEREDCPWLPLLLTFPLPTLIPGILGRFTLVDTTERPVGILPCLFPVFLQ